MIHFLLKCSLFHLSWETFVHFYHHTSNNQNPSESLQPWSRTSRLVGNWYLRCQAPTLHDPPRRRSQWEENHYQMEVAPGSGEGGHLMWIFGVDGCWLLVENGQKARKNSRECFSVKGKSHPNNFFTISASLKNLQIEIQLVSNQRSWVESFQMAPAKEAPAWYLPPGGWCHFHPQLPGPSHSEIKTSSLINMMNMCLFFVLSSPHHNFFMT